MKAKLLFIFLVLFFGRTFAQLSSTEISGYAKYLYSSTKYPFYNEHFDDHLLHARLNTRWYPLQSLTTALEFRFRVYYGESLEKIPGFLNQIKSQHEFANLDAVLWNRGKSLGYLETDRLWLDWTKEKIEVTVGRQRIAWGTSWVWNPTDLFNPQSPLDFDYEELPGTDAVRFQYYTGPVTKIEAAVAPAETLEKMVAAGLISFNKWDFDFNLIGGIKYNRWIAGGGWSGDILDAGFRGEFTVSQRPSLIPKYNTLHVILPYYESMSSFKDPVFSFVLSGDYTFPNSFYIHTEVLYYNIGKTLNVGLYQTEALELGMLSPARLNIYQEFSYNITPLIRGSLFGIYNPNDHSGVIVPSVTYSVITNLDLYVIALLFNGNNLTQYGDYGSSWFIRVKYSF
ncbi:MAG TPA: hypothetical protein VLB50_07425 [Ignavibacteriaceae bacterium]|nr:hypothetical protein [Ignavibacteriaceae bacterium]